MTKPSKNSMFYINNYTKYADVYKKIYLIARRNKSASNIKGIYSSSKYAYSDIWEKL